MRLGILIIIFGLFIKNFAFGAQHDYVISNDTGANVRTDINNALLSIVSQNSGSSAPSTTYAFQLWMDTSGGTPQLKMRNAANSAWITLGDASLTGLGLLARTGGTVSGAVEFSNTDYIKLPVGTTAQRPGSPANGHIRYNSDTRNFEAYHESQFSPLQREFASADYLSNLSLTATVGSSALTVSLKTAAGSNAANGDPVIASFRSATLASGDLSLVKTTGALSVTISSGSTLGHASSQEWPIYVYLINNAGTAELALSTTLYDETARFSTTAEGGAGAADSATAIYSTTARSNVAYRVIGKLLSTQSTAGTWASVPTNIGVATYGQVAHNSGQIKFPSVQQPSSDANTLDDYEEGTFTPIVLGTSTSGSGTYALQIGNYTKVGRVIHYQIHLNWSAHTGTGNIRLGGLPFTSSASSNTQHAATIGYFQNVGLTAANTPMAYTIVSSNQLDLVQMPSGGGAMSSIPMDTSAQIMVSGFYTE